jgi:hypothetical protein
MGALVRRWAEPLLAKGAVIADPGGEDRRDALDPTLHERRPRGQPPRAPGFDGVL